MIWEFENGPMFQNIKAFKLPTKKRCNDFCACKGLKNDGFLALKLTGSYVLSR
jgi:hypothetical protein